MCLERAICWMHRLVGWEVRTRGARFLFCFVGEGESRGMGNRSDAVKIFVKSGKGETGVQEEGRHSRDTSTESLFIGANTAEMEGLGE